MCELVTRYKLPDAGHWMSDLEQSVKRSALIARMKAAGVDTKELGMDDDDNSTKAALAARILERLAVGEL